MFEKFLATFVTLSKVFLLVLFSSMNFWGNSTMAMSMKMPCADQNIKHSKCKICSLAIQTLSQKFVRKSEKKIETPKFVKNIFRSFHQNEISRDFKQKKEVEIFPPPKIFSRNSYLFAKDKIVLVI